MAIKPGTNDLKLIRRHVQGCPKFPGETFQPISKKDQKADTCQCPIWCRGYLANETEVVNGKLKAKRVRASLGCTDWTSAQNEIAVLYQRGSLPSVADSTATNVPCFSKHDRIRSLRFPEGVKNRLFISESFPAEKAPVLI